MEIDRQTKIYRDGVYAILFCHGQATEEELAQSHGQTANGADENDAEGDYVCICIYIYMYIFDLIVIHISVLRVLPLHSWHLLPHSTSVSN